MTAAETRNPTKNIPRAIRGVYIRILVFYIVGVFVSPRVPFAESVTRLTRIPDHRSHLPERRAASDDWESGDGGGVPVGYCDPDFGDQCAAEYH